MLRVLINHTLKNSIPNTCNKRSCNKGCEASWIQAFYHHLETMIHHISKQRFEFCDTNRRRESGDTSLPQECWAKLPDCFSPWGMTVWG